MSSASAPTLLPFRRLAPGALSGSAMRARQATGTQLLVDGAVGTGKAVRASRFLVGGHQWELLYPPGPYNTQCNWANCTRPPNYWAPKYLDHCKPK